MKQKSLEAQMNFQKGNRNMNNRNNLKKVGVENFNVHACRCGSFPQISDQDSELTKVLKGAVLPVPWPLVRSWRRADLLLDYRNYEMCGKFT